MKIYLIRYGEIGLKSPVVRARFERKLADNIQKMFYKKNMECITEILHGRILVHTNKDAREVLSKIFGIVSFSEVICTSNDIDEICKVSVEIAKKKRAKSFAVRVRRVGKHTYTSQELAIMCGAKVKENTKMDVNLTNPELTLHIDVRHSYAYIYTEIIRGPGGLPVETQGRVCGVVRNARDLVAVYLIMKRGCIPVIIESGFSAECLNEWHGDELKTVQISDDSFDSWFDIMKKFKCSALVLGDDLNIIKKIKGKPKFPVFLPLLGYEEKEIRKFGEMLGVKI